MPGPKLAPKRSDLLELGQELASFQRLEEILVRFYELQAADILLGFFFTGRNLQHIARQQARFLSPKLGLLSPSEAAPPPKHPKEAHTDLPPILSGHFDRRLRLLEQVLSGTDLSPKLQRLWLAYEESFRSVVVRDTNSR
jgi:truncated hemoglobin YjbI